MREANRERADADVHGRVEIELVGDLADQAFEIRQVVGANNADDGRRRDLVSRGPTERGCRHSELRFAGEPETRRKPRADRIREIGALQQPVHVHTSELSNFEYAERVVNRGSTAQASRSKSSQRSG
jgi:hypothetical protein